MVWKFPITENLLKIHESIFYWIWLTVVAISLMADSVGIWSL